MSPPLIDHLRLRALVLVETLAETASLHAAARRLNTSQPALTVMLQNVERTLGGTLFERSRRGLVPTDMGLYVIAQTRLMLADLRRVQSEFATRDQGQSLLRVGALQLLMLEIIPRALISLRETMPSARMEFREGAAAELLEALADGSLDLVVGRMLPEFTVKGDLEPAFLFAESFCVIGATHHPLAMKRRVSWMELQEADWIQSPPNTALRDYFVEAFLLRGLKPPQPIYQSASFYSCITIIVSSNCLMMVPREVGRHFSHRSQIRILPVRVGKASAPFSIVKRRSRADTPGMLAFQRAVQQATRSRR